jgi:hypothetical protein
MERTSCDVVRAKVPAAATTVAGAGARVRTGEYNVVCVHGVFADAIALMYAHTCMLSNGVLLGRHK